MSNNAPKKQPIKPAQPSEQSGTPLKKSPKAPLKPIQPSKQAGTVLPFHKQNKKIN